MLPDSLGQSRIALAAVCLSALMLGLEISSVPPALSTIEQVMGASFRQLQWVMTAYTIAMTTILMGVGTLADRYGRKRLFTIGIGVFGLASLVCGLTASAPVLIGARFIQGLGAAMMLICQIAILSSQFLGGQERGRAFACWGIVFGAGLGFGPIVGSALLAVAGWAWVFLVHGLLAVVTLGLSHVGVQESRNPKAGRLDKAGMLTLSIAVFCLVLFVTQGPLLGFSSPAALGILALAAVGLIGFVLAERRSHNPMLVLSVFRVRRFSGALLGSMGMNFSFWPLIIYLPVYFHTVLGYDGLQTGLALTAYTLPTLFAPPWAERLALRWPSGRVISLGLALIALGLGLMAAGTTLPAPEWLLLPGCVIAGLGVGMSNTTASNTITGAVPPERAGMASGADTSARMISLALNIALMGLILVEGIMAALSRTSGATTGIELRLMAEKLAAGDAAVTPDRTVLLQGAADPSAILHLALGTGFTWIMVYGAASAFILALCSTWILTPTRRPQPCPAACIQQGI